MVQKQTKNNITEAKFVTSAQALPGNALTLLNQSNNKIEKKISFIYE